MSMNERKTFGNHCMAMVSDDTDEQPKVIKGDPFSVLTNHNGMNVMRYAVKMNQLNRKDTKHIVCDGILPF